MNQKNLFLSFSTTIALATIECEEIFCQNLNSIVLNEQIDKIKSTLKVITYSKMVKLLYNTIFNEQKLNLFYKEKFFSLKQQFNKIHKSLREQIQCTQHSLSSPKIKKHDNFKLNENKNKIKIFKNLGALSTIFHIDNFLTKIEETKNDFLQKFREEGCKFNNCSQTWQNVEKYFLDFMKILLEIEEMKKILSNQKRDECLNLEEIYLSYDLLIANEHLSNLKEFNDLFNLITEKIDKIITNLENCLYNKEYEEDKRKSTLALDSEATMNFPIHENCFSISSNGEEPYIMKTCSYEKIIEKTSSPPALNQAKRSVSSFCIKEENKEEDHHHYNLGRVNLKKVDSDNVCESKRSLNHKSQITNATTEEDSDRKIKNIPNKLINQSYIQSNEKSFLHTHCIGCNIF